MIRPAVAADADAICDIYNHYVEGTDISFEEVAVTPEQMQQRIAEIQHSYPWLVCIEEGALLGYAYAHGSCAAPIVTVSSARSTWRLKHAAANPGTRLYQQLLPQLREAGCTWRWPVLRCPMLPASTCTRRWGSLKWPIFVSWVSSVIAGLMSATGSWRSRG